MTLTYQQARWRENKPICFYCFVPCDPRSRTYRATRLCEFCYDEQPPLILQKKETL